MSASNTATPVLQAKLNAEDTALLDRIKALAMLRGWPGNWSGNRGEALRAVMDKLVSSLSSIDRELLDVPETTTVRAD